MQVERRELMYTGKAKRVWNTSDPQLVLLEFTDQATAFNGKKKDEIRDKGQINCAISAHLFDKVAAAGVQHHMVERRSEHEMLCHRVEIIPVEVVIRNITAGSFAKRYGVEEGLPMAFPLCEFFYKSDALDDPLMGDDVALVMGWAKRWELAALREQALAVNDVLRRFWSDVGVDLVDFKLEFGRQDGRILLADEITPDGSRLWEKGTRKKLDKDVFRRDLGSLTDTYRALFERVFGHGVDQ